jgi:MFS superfamily sulfate permease-like transporter
MEALGASFHTLSYTATALAAGTVAVMILCRAISNRIPGAIVAFLLGTCRRHSL